MKDAEYIDPRGEVFSMQPEDGDVKTTFEPPIDSIEAALAHVWSEVLGLERVGRQDNFFEIGGTSLLAIQVIERMREQHGIEIPILVIFEFNKLNEMADQLRPKNDEPSGVY